MMEFDVHTVWQGDRGSVAACKQASIEMDTRMEGRNDAFNPAELLLAALSACIIKNIVRVAPILGFAFDGLEVHMHGVRQDKPPRMARIEYRIVLDTDEPDHRLRLLHENIRKYGTVYNTIAPGTVLTGSLARREGS